MTAFYLAMLALPAGIVAAALLAAVLIGRRQRSGAR